MIGKYWGLDCARSNGCILRLAGGGSGSGLSR